MLRDIFLYFCCGATTGVILFMIYLIVSAFFY